jgi:hypothetical protein
MSPGFVGALVTDNFASYTGTQVDNTPVISNRVWSSHKTVKWIYHLLIIGREHFSSGTHLSNYGCVGLFVGIIFCFLIYTGYQDKKMFMPYIFHSFISSSLWCAHCNTDYLLDIVMLHMNLLFKDYVWFKSYHNE